MFPVASGAGGCPYNAAVPPGLFCGRAFSPGLSSQWVVAALIGVLFLRMLGIFVVLPVVSVAAQALQPTAGDWAVGLALGGYGVTQACMQMPVGLLADRWGRKPVLFFALALFTLGGVVAGATEDVRWLVVGRLLQGAGAVATVAIAWMMDVSGEERRARVMAGLGGAIGFAFVCSLFVAGPLVGAVGLSGVFLFAAATGGVSMLLLAPIPSPPRFSDRPPGGWRVLLEDRRWWGCVVGGFALHGALAVFFFWFPLSLDLPIDRQWRPLAGGFFAALPLAGALFFWFHRSPRGGAGFSVFLVMASLIVLAAGDGGLWVPFLFFSGFVVLEAVLPALAARYAPADYRATAIGAVITAEFLGIFAGGFFAGISRQLTEGSLPSVVASCVLLCFWLIIAGGWKEPK